MVDILLYVRFMAKLYYHYFVENHTYGERSHYIILHIWIFPGSRPTLKIDPFFWGGLLLCEYLERVWIRLIFLKKYF